MTVQIMAAQLIAFYAMIPCVWIVVVALELVSVTFVMISLQVRQLVSALAPIPAPIRWLDASIAQANAYHAGLATNLLITM